MILTLLQDFPIELMPHPILHKAWYVVNMTKYSASLWFSKNDEDLDKVMCYNGSIGSADGGLGGRVIPCSKMLRCSHSNCIFLFDAGNYIDALFLNL